MKVLKGQGAVEGLVRCFDCKLNIECHFIPVPVEFARYLIDEDFKFGMKVLNGEVMIANCQKIKGFRIVEAV